jgi:hypothetical protein
LRNTVRQGLLAIFLDVITSAFVLHFKLKTTFKWSLKHFMTRFKGDFTVGGVITFAFMLRSKTFTTWTGEAVTTFAPPAVL